MRFFLLPALLAVCLLGACARKVRVEISSLAAHGETRSAAGMNGRRCLVLPAEADARRDDLQFGEFSAQVSASLAQKGCEPAQKLEDADMAVLLAYGVGEPFAVEERNYVVYRPWGRWGRGMTEFIPVTTTYIFNTCGLRLEARHVEKAASPQEKEAKLGAQAWKISAVHTGQRIDLRAIFPWLLAAAREYYGVDSGQNIMVSVSEEDLLSASPPARGVDSPSGAPAP